MILISNDKKGRTLRRAFCVILALMMVLALTGLFASRANAVNVEYTITVESTDSSAGSASGGKNVIAGDSITISATPNPGYKFAYWTDRYGSTLSVDQDYTFVPEESGTYAAWFVNISDEGLVYSGTVSSVTFPETSEGYSKIQEQAMKINNTGTGSLMFRLSDISISGANPDAFEIRSYWKNHSTGNCCFPNDDIGVLYIRPVTGLDVGTYTAKVTIKERDGNISPLVGNISFTVTTDYVITASSSPTEGGTVSGWGIYKSGDDVTLTASPSAKYKFAGWYEGTNKVSDNAEYTFTATSARDLVAKFEQVEFDIDVDVYDNGEGGSSTVTGAGTYYKGDTVTISAIPDSNVVFSYWLTQYGEEVSTSATYSFSPTVDIKMFAVFRKPETFTVSFESNGGSSVTTQSITEGQKATKPSDPTKADSVFLGWYKDSSLTTEFNFDTPITENTTLYAKYKTLIKEVDCTITKPAEGKSPDMNPISADPSKYDVKLDLWYFYEEPYPTVTETDTFEIGKRYSVRLIFTPKEGYYFDDSITVYNINGERSSSYGFNGYREMIYLIPGKYIVKFNANGHGIAPDSQHLGYDAKAVIPKQPKATGFIFGGWYKDAACTQPYDFNTIVTADITLYAKWTDESAPVPTTGGGFEDFVERLYTVALGRASEPEGKAFWSEHVGNGDLTGAQCANEFLLSKEFNDRGLNDEQFLTVLYSVFFDRKASDDPDGFNFWMNSLKTQGRDVVVDCFINSEEWCNVCATFGVKSGATRAKATVASENATKFATRLYTECLGRDPEEGGLKFWSLGLTNLELTGSAAAHEFFFCQEFNDHNFDNKELITRMYKTFMGREPDDDGMAFWLDSMDKGLTKQQVFDSFVQSPEFTQICKDYAIDRG
ncbi:MAG: InlB B-repeat-containing protein [Clostridiales bacterium]|nr:InlB B-repeat-containing protein [Clostridiales bacterium]